jgi:hypothetical protein
MPGKEEDAEQLVHEIDSAWKAFTNDQTNHTEALLEARPSYYHLLELAFKAGYIASSMKSNLTAQLNGRKE